MSYGAASFGGMVTDHVRRNAYLSVLDDVVGPETRVLDLGCGTGFFTLAALERGAAQVVGVELLDPVRLLPRVVADNGYADRCEIYQGDVRELDLGTFDVVISDMRGSVPLYYDHLDVITHVHNELLAPGAVLLPYSDTLNGAVVTLPEWYDRRASPWSIDDHDWSHYRSLVLSSPTKFQTLEHDALLSEPVEWGNVDYHDPLSLAQRHIGGAFGTRATDGGMAHGICLWFDATIAPGVTYSTQPSNHAPTYGRMVHPFAEPLEILAGESLSIEVMAHRSKKSWTWEWGISASRGHRTHTSLDSIVINPVELSAEEPKTPSRLL